MNESQRPKSTEAILAHIQELQRQLFEAQLAAHREALASAVNVFDRVKDVQVIKRQMAHDLDCMIARHNSPDARHLAREVLALKAEVDADMPEFRGAGRMERLAEIAWRVMKATPATSKEDSDEV